MNPCASYFSRLSRSFVGLFLLLGLGFGAASAAQELRPFDAKSLSAIRDASQAKPFILAFWSLHCAPCKDEMPLFKALQAKYPSMRIVLVATDDVDEHPAVLKFLAKHQLEGIESWAFADEFAERVRFSVDKAWRGELPKTYFFDRDHKATVQTGKLELPTVEAWIATVEGK